MREHLPAPIVGKLNANPEDILRSPEAKESMAELNVLQSAFWFSRFVFEGECNTSPKRRDLSVFHSHVHFRNLSDAQITQ